MGTVTVVLGSDKVSAGLTDTRLVIYQMHVMGQSYHTISDFIRELCHAILKTTTTTTKIKIKKTKQQQKKTKPKTQPKSQPQTNQSAFFLSNLLPLILIPQKLCVTHSIPLSRKLDVFISTASYGSVEQWCFLVRQCLCTCSSLLTQTWALTTAALLSGNRPKYYLT